MKMEFHPFSQQLNTKSFCCFFFFENLISFFYLIFITLLWYPDTLWIFPSVCVCVWCNWLVGEWADLERKARTLMQMLFTETFIFLSRLELPFFLFDCSYVAIYSDVCVCVWLPLLLSHSMYAWVAMNSRWSFNRVRSSSSFRII